MRVARSNPRRSINASGPIARITKVSPSQNHEGVAQPCVQRPVPAATCARAQLPQALPTADVALMRMGQRGPERRQLLGGMQHGGPIRRRQGTEFLLRRGMEDDRPHRQSITPLLSPWPSLWAPTTRLPRELRVRGRAAEAVASQTPDWLPVGRTPELRWRAAIGKAPPLQVITQPALGSTWSVQIGINGE